MKNKLFVFGLMLSTQGLHGISTLDNYNVFTGIFLGVAVYCFGNLILAVKT